MQGLDLFHFGVRLMAVGENTFWEPDTWIRSSFLGLRKREVRGNQSLEKQCGWYPTTPQAVETLPLGQEGKHM